MARKPVKSAAAIIAAYQRGMQGARQAYLDGVNAITESPGAAAATPEATNLYLQSVQESVSSGRRQAALTDPGFMSRYKEGATKKGADRLASGAMAAATKQQSVLQKWQPVYQQVRDAVAGMPKGGSANAKARAAAAIDILMAAAGKS